jgi:hypothetical protein
MSLIRRLYTEFHIHMLGVLNELCSWTLSIVWWSINTIRLILICHRQNPKKMICWEVCHKFRTAISETVLWCCTTPAKQSFCPTGRTFSSYNSWRSPLMLSVCRRFWNLFVSICLSWRNEVTVVILDVKLIVRWRCRWVILINLPQRVYRWRSWCVCCVVSFRFLQVAV